MKLLFFNIVSSMHLITSTVQRDATRIIKLKIIAPNGARYLRHQLKFNEVLLR